MAERTPRILYANLLAAASALGRSSSEDSAATIYSMLDPQPTRKWRSATVAGQWVVVVGFRDKLDVKVIGVARVATLTGGVYTTPDAYAAMVIAALEAADATPIWTVTYSSVTSKFTIGTGGVSFELNVTAGPNLARSAYADLGFTTSRVNVGGSTEVGDAAVYHQSGHWLAWDLGTAQAFTAAALYAHNLGSTGTVTFYASDTSGIWNVADRDFTQVLTGDALANKRIAFFTQQSYRYVGFVIDEEANADGWVEIGHAQVSDDWQPGRSYRYGMTQQPQFLSNLIRTVEGGKFRGARRMPLGLDLTFSRLSRADFDIFIELLRETQDEHVYLALDPLSFPGSRTYYGMIGSVDGIPETVGDGTPPDRYTISFTFEEAPAS